MSPRRSTALRLGLDIAPALALGVAFRYSGAFFATHDALVEMGFDAARAQLITALVTGAICASAAGLLTGRRRVPALAGAAIALFAFRLAFYDETRAALASSGADGSFSPAGWAATAVALLGGTFLFALAGATLATELRRWILAAWLPRVREARDAARVRAAFRRLSLPAGVTMAGLIAVAIATSVFADMVNYSPDADMRTGGGQRIGLVGPAQGAAPSVGPVATLPPSVAPDPKVSATWTSAARPWLTWRPSGSGRVEDISFSAPWTSGRSTSTQVQVYLPPGYDTSSRRYPVTYEVPWSISSWQHAVAITSALDTLITSGRIPAQVVVFIPQHGGPFVNSECVDSADGRERMETFITRTVVSAIDARYRTVATAAARAVMGFSDGGFCSAMLAMTHPDVFDASISFSGYFTAALRSNQTINAWMPFGGDTAMIAAHSPLQLATTDPASVRSRLYLVVCGDPAERLYGQQMVAFASALARGGVPRALVTDPIGHSWREVRTYLATALADVAARQVTLGVFGTSA